MRTVITENTVSALVEIAAGEFPRIFEQFEALEWRLAHKPESGVELVGEFFVYRQARVLKTLPELVVLYTFTSQTVNILAVRLLY